MDSINPIAKEKKNIQAIVVALRKTVKKAKKSFWKRYDDLECVTDDFLDIRNKKKHDKTNIRSARRATLWMLTQVERSLDADRLEESYWLLGFVVGVLYSFELVELSGIVKFNKTEKIGFADSVFWIDGEVSFEDLKEQSL